MWYYADMRKKECDEFTIAQETHAENKKLELQSSCDAKHRSFSKLVHYIKNCQINETTIVVKGGGFKNYKKIVLFENLFHFSYVFEIIIYRTIIPRFKTSLLVKDLV